MDQTNELFARAPIPKAVAKSAIPAIISMLVVVIYNLADTFFVGQTGDPLQVAAVSVTTPVFLLFMAVGTLFGIGGTSLISRALGMGKRELARQASSFCFYGSVAVGVLLMLLFWAFMPQLLSVIGTTENTYALAREYLVYVTACAPFVIVSQAFSNIIRAEGKATQAMLGSLLGTVVNIVLDPIMILGMGMGVKGAAIATVIGNICSAIYYIGYFLAKRSILSISPRDFRMQDGILTKVLAIGIPASLNNILMSVSNIILNNFLAGYGDNQVAAMGVAMKANMIVVCLLLGVGQGVQPLLGYNYGAKNYDRARDILRFSLIASVVFGAVLTALCWFGAEPIVRMFINSAEVVGYGVTMLKAVMLSGPFLGILYVLTNALQAMDRALPSFILSIGRQGLIYIPLLCIISVVSGFGGIIYAQAITDYLTIFLSAFLYLHSHRAIACQGVPDAIR